MKFKNLTIEKVLSDIPTFDIDPNDSYILTYPEFLKYFQNTDRIERHHLIIGSHFVYGWMPTIIDLNKEFLTEAIDLLNRAKNNAILDEDELGVLKSCINNSMVGASKLLHFINPHRFPIWDSRIFRYITEKVTSYGIDKPANYLSYIKRMDQIVKDPRFHLIEDEVIKHFDIPISQLRMVELVMFQADRAVSSPLDPLFYHEPGGWGLRGDPFLWKALRTSLSKINVSESDELKSLLYQKANEILGEELKPDKEIFVEEFSKGGMSSGYVSSNFWIEKGFPLLLNRFKERNNKRMEY